MRYIKTVLRRATIRDKAKSGALSFDLPEILSALPPIAKELHWRLLELDGEGKPANGMSWQSVQARVEHDPRGARYSWSELASLPSVIFQSYDLTLVGALSPFMHCEFPIELATMRQFILIEAFDSSYWTVTSDLPEVIDMVAGIFKDVAVEEG